jgi:hypothetical protein
MKTQLTEGPKPTQQDLRHYPPRWMAVLVVIILIPQLIMFPAAGRGLWYMPGLVLMGLLQGGRLVAWFSFACSVGGIEETAESCGLGIP